MLPNRNVDGNRNTRRVRSVCGDMDWQSFGDLATRGSSTHRTRRSWRNFVALNSSHSPRVMRYKGTALAEPGTLLWWLMVRGARASVFLPHLAPGM